MDLMTEREEHNARTSARWRRMRALYLQLNPTCAMCQKEGRIPVEPATVADHIEQVEHSRIRFWTGALQGLCEHHHNRAKQLAEKDAKRGYSREIGASGWPTDPRHPVYRYGK
jgi:hypothetical protein